MRGSDEASSLWSIRIVGTTWLTRGPAYWLRRVLFWLMWVLATVMVTAMAIGIDIGLARGTGPAARLTIFGISGAANIAVLILTLWKLWPTAKRAREWAFKERRTAGRASRGGRPTGAGAVIGVAAISSGPLAAFVIAPMVVLGAAGMFLALLVIASLPQLPEEAIMRCRRETLSKRYSPS